MAIISPVGVSRFERDPLAGVARGIEAFGWGWEDGCLLPEAGTPPLPNT